MHHIVSWTLYASSHPCSYDRKTQNLHQIFYNHDHPCHEILQSDKISTNAFYATNLFLYFSRYHVLTQSIAPFSWIWNTYNPNYSIHPWNISLRILSSGHLALPIQLIKPNTPPPNWCNTTVFLETYPRNKRVSVFLNLVCSTQVLQTKSQ